MTRWDIGIKILTIPDQTGECPPLLSSTTINNQQQNSILDIIIIIIIIININNKSRDKFLMEIISELQGDACHMVMIMINWLFRFDGKLKKA